MDNGKVTEFLNAETRTIGRRVLREEVRDRLISDILKGRLQPGSRIVETRIAKEFSISQAPVREALRDLELLGFVVCTAFRGTRVRRISWKELTEVYPIRAILEGFAARTTATRIEESTLEHLEELLASMRNAASRGDERAQIDADVAFHQVIVEASDNHLLQQVWKSMRLATTTFLSHTIGHRSPLELAERHVPVLAALRARDPALAEAAMRRHIEEPGEWVRAAMEQEQEVTRNEAEENSAERAIRDPLDESKHPTAQRASAPLLTGDARRRVARETTGE